MTPREQQYLGEAATLETLLGNPAVREHFGSNLHNTTDYANMLAQCKPAELAQAFTQLRKYHFQHLNTPAGAKWLIEHYGSFVGTPIVWLPKKE